MNRLSFLKSLRYSFFALVLKKGLLFTYLHERMHMLAISITEPELELASMIVLSQAFGANRRCLIRS